MNEVHLRGVVKTEPWRYDNNLYVRLSVRRDTQRPGRSPQAGGDFDYVTVLFPGGAAQGLELRRNQILAVHGWLQSRDVSESLSEFLRRAQPANGSAVEVPDDPPSVHRSVVEVVADRWQIERS